MNSIRDINSFLSKISKQTKYVDLRYGNIEERIINSINGSIIKDIRTAYSGYGIRFLSKGIISFTSAPELQIAYEDINKLLKTSNIIATWKKGVSKLCDAPIIQATTTKTPKKDWENLEKSEIKQIITDIENYIREKLKIKVRIEIDLLFIKWSEVFRNSEGTSIFQSYPYTVMTLTGRLSENGNQRLYYKNFGGLGGLEVLPYDDLEKLDEFIQIVNNLPYAKNVGTSNYNVVLNEDIAWILTHEVLGHSLEADNVLSGHSFYAGLQGMKIAPSYVSVIDDPYLETIGYYEFDSEGMKGRGTLLVDDGILTDFLHSRETAAAMGGESSANYRAYSFEHLPQVRMSNTFIEPKDFSFEELLEQVKNGIYICDGYGGSSEPQTGDFNIDSQYAREIKNGELGGYLRGVQLTGKISQTLSLIKGIGDRLLAQPGSCVKNNQRIFTGSVSPKIAIFDQRVS
ncbi:MAG: TldD/PmbA family protein [Candidatus Heimdallarchaeaceae archaeon]